MNIVSVQLSVFKTHITLIIVHALACSRTERATCGIPLCTYFYQLSVLKENANKRAVNRACLCLALNVISSWIRATMSRILNLRILFMLRHVQVDNHQILYFSTCCSLHILEENVARTVLMSGIRSAGTSEAIPELPSCPYENIFLQVSDIFPKLLYHVQSKCTRNEAFKKFCNNFFLSTIQEWHLHEQG